MLRFAWICALFALACDGTISVTFFTGPQEFDVSVEDLAPPEELRDPSNDTIRSVSCGPEGMCPPSDSVVLTCESNVCDPAPQTIEAPIGSVIDIEALLAETREIGVSRVESYTFEE